MWPNQANLIPTKQPWPHLFLFSPKESVGCGWMHYFRDKKMSRLNGRSTCDMRGSGRSQSGDFDLCILLWCGWFCSMRKNTLFARKNFVFPPSLETPTRVHSFLPFKTFTRFRSFLPFNGAALRGLCTSMCMRRERESVFVIYHSLKDFF